MAGPSLSRSAFATKFEERRTVIHRRVADLARHVAVSAGSMVGFMDVGALIFPTDVSIRPDLLARELEERGFESLWVTEHTHIPTSRLSPWPGGPVLPE